MSSIAYLLIDDRGPEIQHRSGLTAPDPFIYLYPDGDTPTVFFDAREYEVQKTKLSQLNNGVHIEYLEPYLQKAQLEKIADPLLAALFAILNKKNIDTVRLSPSTPYAIVHALENENKKILIHSYAAEREHKSEEEIKHLIDAQRVNETAFLLAWQILSDSTIHNQHILYQNHILTSEYLKSQLRKHLLDQGYDCPAGIIVASGNQTAQPHEAGHGPLLPHQCIIIDIFPRSEATGYFADMTRTFVKGKPSPGIRKIFTAVENVQQQALDTIKVGDHCQAIHQQAIDAFAKLGYETSHERGFMHGTGHSLGLSIHEDPRLNAQSKRIIEPGMVFTVEPGLYYPGLGGVRIEDVVIFHLNGQKQNITQFTKPFFIP